MDALAAQLATSATPTASATSVELREPHRPQFAALVAVAIADRGADVPQSIRLRGQQGVQE